MYLSPDELTPYENNTRRHNPEDIEQIKDSICKDGFNDPIGVWGEENVIVEGHGRLLAAKEIGLDKVPCIRLDHMTDTQRRDYAIRHNRTAELSAWDFGKLEEEIARLEIEGVDLSGLNFDIDIADTDRQTQADADHAGKLNQKFGVPPFSVLDARQGYWQERKKWWRDIIGDVGQARDSAAAYTASLITDKYGIASPNTTSILDPVLSEIVCRWFAPHDGCKVFDCFAGDTVFGYVSAYLGHSFTGIELREEQVDFNTKSVGNLDAQYICDDGRHVADHLGQASQDLFFSCPPYFDLEQYSDLPNDASNQETYEDFYKIIDEAFTKAVGCLKDDRFAVVVCGDVRDKRDGRYYGFPDDIKQTMIRNGLVLYNEMILVDPVGTATIRANNNMKSRKVVKVHQNVLVFYKGDTRKISKVFPEIEVDVDASEDLEF